jgi:hypothetical protein
MLETNEAFICTHAHTYMHIHDRETFAHAPADGLDIVARNEDDIGTDACTRTHALTHTTDGLTTLLTQETWWLGTNKTMYVWPWPWEGQNRRYMQIVFARSICSFVYQTHSYIFRFVRIGAFSKRGRMAALVCIQDACACVCTCAALVCIQDALEHNPLYVCAC